MRDPTRIGVIIDQLAALWRTYPDMRLGQLIHNLTPPGQDAWNIEEGDWLYLICEAREGRWPRVS